MAFSGGGGQGGPLSEINVTPLVDVMLVLLIIFMVAAPMLTTGVSVDLPNAQAPSMEVDDEKPLIVVARPPDDAEAQDQRLSRVYFFEEEVTLEQLEMKLTSDARVLEHREVYVQADESVPYGEVVRVLAIVRKVGIEKMGLVTDPLARE